MDQIMTKFSFRKTLLFLLLISATTSVYADGLPGEYLISSRWRDLLWYHSPLSNPAFLTDENFITVHAAYSPVLQNAFTLGEFGLSVPILLNQTASITVLNENDGVVKTSQFDETQNRLIAGGSSISNDNVYTVGSYAISPIEHFGVGANLSLAYQSNFGDPTTGAGFDLGVSWKPLTANAIQNYTLGLSTVNLISPDMGNSPYSRNLRLSLVTDFLEKTFEGGIDIDMRDFWTSASDFKASGDAKAAAKALEMGVACRAGYWFRHMISLWAQAGFDEHAFEYWGIAAGMKVPLHGNHGIISMLYQYNIKAEGDWASSHTFYLIAEFGKNRKDLWSKHIVQAKKENDWLAKLKKVRGLKIVEEREYIRITAEEVAVHFASGSAELPVEAVPALKEIATFMRTWPDHQVTIEGHTDNDPITGKLKDRFIDNKNLSKARCEAVKRYFVDTEMLSEKLFTTEGYGETKPLYPNDTKEHKYKNRRVVVLVKK